MATILIVEDESSIATLLRDMLEDEQYAVLLAQNGQAALDIIADSPPNLIISDVMMPLVDGLELCRMLQAQPDYAQIPIILMSAMLPPTDREGCPYLAFFQKPFDVQVVLDTVANLLGDRHQSEP